MRKKIFLIIAIFTLVIVVLSATDLAFATVIRLPWPLPQPKPDEPKIPKPLPPPEPIPPPAPSCVGEGGMCNWGWNPQPCCSGLVCSGFMWNARCVAALPPKVPTGDISCSPSTVYFLSGQCADNFNLCWETTNAPDPSVYYDDPETGTEILMHKSVSGCDPVSWICSYHPFTFKLYANGQSNLLDSCTVYTKYPPGTVCNVKYRCVDDPTCGADPWFQTQGGDVHAGTDIRSKIPTTATNKNFCRDLDNYPGVVSYAGTSAVFSPGGTASSKGWLANSSTLLPHNFTYFYNLLDSPGKNWDGKINSFPGFPGAGETKILYTDTDVAHIPAGTFSSGGKLIILANANAIVNQGDVIVNPGSFLAVISSGRINIDEKVGRVQGIYVADGHISTGSAGEKLDNPFTGQGIFYSPSIVLARSPARAANKTTPAELFTFRPDLWVNAPKELWKASYTWQELAP